MAIIGEAALSGDDRRVLAFARSFEEQFVGQGLTESRSCRDAGFGLRILAPLPAEMLKRIPLEYIQQYHQAGREEVATTLVTDKD